MINPKQQEEYFISETKYASIRMRNGILWATYADGIEVDLHIAIEIVKQRHEASNYRDVLLLVDGRGVKGMTKEARDYLSTDEASLYTTAAALLAKSPVTIMLGNFFIKVSYRDGKVPIKLFVSERQALRWLDKFRT